ncbi:hypothetical protein COOONC_15058 [Cooperia oncophora]
MSRYRSESDENRGRTTSRPTSDGLSTFYRERFGSHSPEEYMNLRISGFDDKLEREEIKEILANEFRKFAPFEIKVVRNPGDEERLAYVNFERRDCARKVRYTVMDRLRKVLGRRVLCDPAGILRDQEGKYIPDRFNRALQGDRSGRRSPDRRSRPKEPPQWRLKEDDSDATRTLFVGNMPSDIRESEIRKTALCSFDAQGPSSVDIPLLALTRGVLKTHFTTKFSKGMAKLRILISKPPANTDAAYAFVMFQNLEQAMEAKHGEHDRSIRPGSVRCKIGYGKSQVMQINGDSFASQIRIVQRKSVMLRDDTRKEAKRRECVGTKKQAQNLNWVTQNAASTPQPIVKTFEELDEEYATTWQGQVLLKKTEYSIKLYRIGGTERLIQKLLRDDDGNAVKLHSPKSDYCVVTVTAGLLYIFPHSDMATKLITHFAPTVRLMSQGCPFLFFVLGLKTSSAAASPNR